MNAKKELMAVLERTGAKILAAQVSIEREVFGEEEEIEATLGVKEAKCSRAVEAFFDKIDVEYDEGFGAQYVFGIVWLDDGTWLERNEYDGSEWWVHRVLPDIPRNLRG